MLAGMPAAPPPATGDSTAVPLRRWLLATRPGFLLVTAAAVVMGVAQSQACGCGWDPVGAAATLLLALLAHAAVNLYNDYGDWVGGSDACNRGRLTPFSGGSRAILDGRLSPAQVREAASILGLVVVGGGILLAARAGPGLLLVGLLGGFLGWAYSHPGLRLMARGLGEPAVALGWWLVVVGADYVQRHGFHVLTAVAAVPLALLVLAILWAAEFPDAAADAAVGKRTWVVRWGPVASAWACLALVLAAHAWVWVWWWVEWLPSPAWWALGAAPVSLASATGLIRHAREPARLRPVIAGAIAAAVLHAGLMSAAFVVVARLR